MNLLLELIRQLGPSGSEGGVRDLIRKEMKKYVNEVFVDNVGNLICHRKGKGEKVMLAAHMDEVGLMIKKIEENGFIRLTTIGGIEPISLIGQGVIILNEKYKDACKGIITFAEFHDATKIEGIPRIEELYVDTGVSKKELVKMGVTIGNYIIPLHATNFLGSNKIMTGKALDDRIGCYALIELARRLRNTKLKVDMYYVFTVQEEIGMYGAKAAAWNIKPDWGIAVETTTSKDSDIRGSSVIGKGPFLTIKDAQMVSNRCLDDWIKKTAKKHKLPLQLEVDEFGTTDATNIMLSRGGISSTTIAVAVRNIHSTVGICHLDDVENMIKILYHGMRDPPKVCDV